MSKRKISDYLQVHSAKCHPCFSAALRASENPITSHTEADQPPAFKSDLSMPSKTVSGICLSYFFAVYMVSSPCLAFLCTLLRWGERGWRKAENAPAAGGVRYSTVEVRQCSRSLVPGIQGPGLAWASSPFQC